MSEKNTSLESTDQQAEHVAKLKASFKTPDKRATTPAQYLKNAWAHFGTITHHKALVFELCARCGIPWQGLVHDLSKYSPEEFMAGVRFYQGNRSPNTAERNANGFSRAWIHHKGRNKHHYEYWTDMRPGQGGTLFGNLIPTKYVVEMFCDRVAASKVYAKENYRDSSPLEYLQLELTAGNLPFHPESAAFLYVLLEHLAEHGETETLRFIRKNIIEAHYVYAPGATFD